MMLHKKILVLLPLSVLLIGCQPTSHSASDLPASDSDSQSVNSDIGSASEIISDSTEPSSDSESVSTSEYVPTTKEDIIADLTDLKEDLLDLNQDVTERQYSTEQTISYSGLEMDVSEEGVDTLYTCNGEKMTHCDGDQTIGDEEIPFVREKGVKNDTLYSLTYYSKGDSSNSVTYYENTPDNQSVLFDVGFVSSYIQSTIVPTLAYYEDDSLKLVTTYNFYQIDLSTDGEKTLYFNFKYMDGQTVREGFERQDTILIS
ncbi:MAG: hypothetical protein WCR67_02250 [Bacilli bacterium]